MKEMRCMGESVKEEFMPKYTFEHLIKLVDPARTRPELFFFWITGAFNPCLIRLEEVCVINTS